MDLDRILEELRALFGTYQVDRIEAFLEENIEQAYALGDTASVIALMNEAIEYLRDTGKQDRALYYCDRLMELMRRAGMEGSVPYGTALLNVANTYLSVGKLQEAMAMFQAVETIYEGRVPEDDMLYADFYSDLGQLYQQMGDYKSAGLCLKRALAIVSRKAGQRLRAAVIYTSLATVQLQMGELSEAAENLERAFSIFEMDEEKDIHYGGALAAMAQVQYLMGNLEESERYYTLALREVKAHTGENQSYEIILQNLREVQRAKEKLPGVQRRYAKGMDLCEDFYREYGVPMIRSRFPEYEKVIAAGLVGEGSECFGFDDTVSRDHDFGPGFCLWLTDSVYDEIGEQLQEEYEKLPTTYMGITRRQTQQGKKRVGVFRISDFYEQLTGLSDVPTTQNQWLFIEDYQLAAATNGKVFRDDLGEFSRIRKELLKHYPEEVRVKRIAREAALMAQSGQYNYSRMYGRGERVTACIALSEFMKHTMMMVYLLNHRYAPFYKWMHRGMENLAILPQIREILDQLAAMPVGDERIPETIEFIVALIIREMKKQGLTSGDDNYLEHHTEKILKSLPQKDQGEESFKAALINELAELKWEEADRTAKTAEEDKEQQEQYKGQYPEQYEGFSLLYKSRYYLWTVPMLKSYIHDLHVRKTMGKMPEASVERAVVTGGLATLHSEWMEEFAVRFPKTAFFIGKLCQAIDPLQQSSYQEYMKQELQGYSDETLGLYEEFVEDLCRKEQNPVQLLAQNIAFLQGMGSLEELEADL